MARLLVIDDDRSFGPILASLLRQAGHEAEHVPSGEEGLQRVEEEAFDLVLCDLLMPGMSGLDVLQRLTTSIPEVPVLLISAHAAVPDVVAAMQRGAVDFVEKPIDRDQLLSVVEKALAIGGRDEVSREIDQDSVVNGLQIPRADLDRIARSDAAILLLGDTGTGKSHLARRLHELSQRAEGPLVTVDCGALPESLIESELFGHVRGAFTGATSNRPGAARRAQGGTLFLDEVADLPLTAQVKLLRLIQEHEVRPVGSDDPVRVDIRVIAATRRDLNEMVEAGSFRDDLYFRLAVLPIELPPMRARPGAVASFATAMLARHGSRLDRPLRLSADGIAALEAHDWPGNLRELDNVIARLAVMCRSEEVGSAEVDRWLDPTRSLPSAASSTSSETSSPAIAGGLTARRQASERDAIVEALQLEGGNRQRAANLLGISRRTLYNKMKELEIASSRLLG